MKKLSDIKIELKDRLLFSITDTIDIKKDGLGVPQIPSIIFSTVRNVAYETFRTNGNLSYSIKRGSIQAVCDNSSDYFIIQESFVSLLPYPDAQKMLWHYLTGNGESVEVDTKRIFNEDLGVRTVVFNEISTGIAKGKTSGVVNVKQSNYKNGNWRNAFGTINVPWELKNDIVKLGIQDVYDWHEMEPRVTQCIHLTMRKAEKNGAQKFDTIGTEIEISKYYLDNYKRFDRIP